MTFRVSIWTKTEYGRLLETWLWRRAHRVEPATDVYLGVGFAAVMPGSGGVRGLGVPAIHSEIGIPASNHEPMDRAGGHESTDLTSEFLQCCHASVQISGYVLTLPSTAA